MQASDSARGRGLMGYAVEGPPKMTTGSPSTASTPALAASKAPFEARVHQESQPTSSESGGGVSCPLFKGKLASYTRAIATGEDEFPYAMDVQDRYSPIEDYGVIGNLRTSALVNKNNASIDWFCFPYFDSPSVFGALLDSNKGGFMRVMPVCPCVQKEAETTAVTPAVITGLSEGATGNYIRSLAELRKCTHIQHKQLYITDTNVLVSRFLSEEGVCQVTDFMPVSKDRDKVLPWIVREVSVVRGKMTVGVDCFPAFDYGRAPHTVETLEPLPLSEYEPEIRAALRAAREAAYPGESKFVSQRERIKKTKISTSSDAEGGRDKDSNAESPPLVFGHCFSPSIRFSTSDVRFDLSIIVTTEVDSPSFAGHTHAPLKLDPLASSVDIGGSAQPTQASTTATHGGPAAAQTAAPAAPRTAEELDEHARQVRQRWERAKEAYLLRHNQLPPQLVPDSSRSGPPTESFLSSIATIPIELVKRPSLPGYGARTRVILHEGQKMHVVLRFACAGETVRLSSQAKMTHETCDELKSRTSQFWRDWIAQSTYRGRWREQVHRSALVLKLMTFEPTGAIVASPSASLPEQLGGSRNWDYRYTWIRDAAFTVYAFLRLGFTAEADAYLRWIEQRCKETGPDGSLQIMYGIDGRHNLEELKLDHLEGYKGSAPVRMGNHASTQMQLDIYGELMDSIYLSNKHSAPISFEFWCHLRKLLHFVCENWNCKDSGIWEMRGDKQHFVYSKLMCWVALDRGVRIAEDRSFPSERERWSRVRDEIYEDIMLKGWSENLQAFQQCYGRDTLDASNLYLPLVSFLSPNDPRVLSMLDAILKPPEKGGLVANNLCFRYNVTTTDDGLTGEEGTFSMCSFWLAECLARAARFDSARTEHAVEMFEQMIGYANHLGLYSEQVAKTGEALGNFPQAFTHLALISAVFVLDSLLGR